MGHKESGYLTPIAVILIATVDMDSWCRGRKGRFE